MDERLGELREDLVSQRQQRRIVYANSVAILLGVSIIAAEVTTLGTGLVANHRTVVAVLFAISSGSALLAVLFALARLIDTGDAPTLVLKASQGMIAAAAVLAVIGAFVAAWPA